MNLAFAASTHYFAEAAIVWHMPRLFLVEQFRCAPLSQRLQANLLEVMPGQRVAFAENYAGLCIGIWGGICTGICQKFWRGGLADVGPSLCSG